MASSTDLGATQSSPGTAATEPRTVGDDNLSPQQIGRFEITGQLGKGGMGVVLAARDPDLDRRVALKLLWTDGEAPDVAAARLAREAQAMARLAHPNVVTVHEVARAGDRLFIAMELVDGGTLRSWLAEEPRTWREIVAMFVGAGRGLAAAHAAGLVHRDFKPDNVLIGKDGRPRVSDFGLVSASDPARALRVSAPSTGSGSDITLRGTVSGTPAYMSPQQWAGEQVDARSDQFSFCVALWEALYRARPAMGRDVTTLREQVLAGQITAPARKDVPSWLEAALRRGLAVEPDARWPSLDVLIDELERRSGKRRVWMIALAATSGAALAAAAVVGYGATRPESGPSCNLAADHVASAWGIEALWSAGGDRARAITLARAALAETSNASSAEQRQVAATVTAWLAERTR